MKENSKNIFIPGISNILESTENSTVSPISTTQENYPLLENQGTYEQLNELFESENTQERKVQETREILGESAKDLTDDQVFELFNNVQFLAEIWEEEFEKAIFDGKTVNELLGIPTL